MTYVKRVSISNLGGRASMFEHDFDSNLNVFWGLNGSGKTTLLRVIHAALSDEVEGLDVLPFGEATVEFYSERHGQYVTRSLIREDRKPSTRTRLKSQNQSDFYVEDDMRIVRHAPRMMAWQTESSSQELNSHEFSTRFTHRYLPIERMHKFSESREDRYEVEDFGSAINRIWFEHRAVINGKVRDIQQTGLAQILATLFEGGAQPPYAELDADDLPSRIDPAEAFELVSAFLRSQKLRLRLDKKKFSERYVASAAHQAVVRQVQSVTQNTEEVQRPQAELESVLGEMYAANKNIEFRSESRFASMRATVGDTRIPISRLSSGEKQLLSILINTLTAGESAVLIDEPELSMHPDWQMSLLGSMRRINPSAQIIVATHSPDLAASVPVENMRKI